MPELNKVKQKCILAKEQYLRNLTTIDSMLPLTKKQLNSSNLAIPRWFENVVSKEEMEEMEQKLKGSLQSKKLFFHGTGNGGDDVLLAVITNGLMSRKKQMEIQEWSRYNTHKGIHESKEEGRREYSKWAEDFVFFSTSFQQAYGAHRKGPTTHFAVGIPEGIARRNYSMARHLGIGETNAGEAVGGERVLLDRDNPQGGCVIKPGDAYLFIGTELFQRLKSSYEKAGEEDFNEKVKATWGDKLVVSNNIPPESIEGLNLPPVKHARLLPTKYLHTEEFADGRPARSYKIVYS